MNIKNYTIKNVGRTSVRPPKQKWSLFLIVLATTIPTLTNAQSFDRFFTTRAERDYLEQQRYAPPKVDIDLQSELVTYELEDEKPVAEQKAIPLPDLPGIEINGFVSRGKSNSTVWVNGQNSESGDLESQYLQVKGVSSNTKQVPISIPLTRKSLSLKPGQKYLPEDDTIVEIYSRKAELNVPEE